MNETRKVKWGILGYARIARETIIPAIMRSSNAEFYAIASRDKTKIEECRSKYAFSKAYESYEAILDDPDVEAVYIPLPNAMHREWTIKAAKKGKHVLCEKPVALNSGECREMINVCRDNNVYLMEAFMYRYTDRIRKVREIISSGVLGEIKYINSCFRFLLTNPLSIKLKPELGGGSLYDVGSYPVNFIGMVTGEEPVSISAECIKENGIDVILSAVLKYQSGIIAALHCGFNAQKRIYSEITGTKGSLEIPDTFLDDEGYISLVTDKGIEKIAVARSDRYCLEIEDFSNAVLTGGKPYLVIEESLLNSTVLERILEKIK
jgi:D-xylose 1-dehydrogenase (NADP+, D-xylono-1,5-lactone-forming)